MRSKPPSWKGKTHSPETRAKISESVKKAYAEGRLSREHLSELAKQQHAAGEFALTTNTLVQLLGAGDLVLSTSPPTVATSGPLIQGVTLRVRSVAGACQVVVVGNNGLTEFAIPTLTGIGLTTQATFPGGPGGC